MFKLRFNTVAFQNRKRRDWEAQLMNDYTVKINGKEFICESAESLLKRLSIVAGNDLSGREEDYFQLESERYGKQTLKYGMYGIAQGYIDSKKVVAGAYKEGYYKLSFSDFYDMRQGNFFKGCYVEIFKVA